MALLFEVFFLSQPISESMGLGVGVGVLWFCVVLFSLLRVMGSFVLSLLRAMGSSGTAARELREGYSICFMSAICTTKTAHKGRIGGIFSRSQGCSRVTAGGCYRLLASCCGEEYCGEEVEKVRVLDGTGQRQPVVWPYGTYTSQQAMAFLPALPSLAPSFRLCAEKTINQKEYPAWMDK